MEGLADVTYEPTSAKTALYSAFNAAQNKALRAEADAYCEFLGAKAVLT